MTSIKDIFNGIKKVFEPYLKETDEESTEALSRAMSGHGVQDVLWSKMFELDSQIEGSDHYLVDIYFDDNSVYALYVDRGKLYRYEIAIENNNLMLGERIEVMEVHQPVETRTVIRQQDDGRYRWFSVSGTAVLNRSGEIDSRNLFDSFVEHAEETGIYPIRMFYHQGQVSRNGVADEAATSYRTGQADFLARDGYCYITSGLYDDTPLAKVEIEARKNNPNDWGDSIGFWPWDRGNPYELTEIANGISIPMYQDGINVEITTLPEVEASHLFTRTEVQEMALTGKARQAFLKMFTDAGQTEDDMEKWLEENPTARNRAIEEAGLITRDNKELKELETLFAEDPAKALEWLETRAKEQEQEEESEEKPKPEPVPAAEFEIDDSVVAEISRSVIESEFVKNLTTQLTERGNEIKELQADLADTKQRLAKLETGEVNRQQEIEDDTPAKFNGSTKVVYRPRLANAAIVEDGMAYNEKAMKNMPKGAY